MSLAKRSKPVLTLSLEETFPFLGEYKHYLDINGESVPVYVDDLRYELFKQAQTCVVCGKVGNHFMVHCDPIQEIPRFKYVLNLFSADGSLMTADHIIPKSMGGRNFLCNLQVMCSKCNSKKGSKMPSPEVIAEVEARVKEHQTQAYNERMANFEGLNNKQQQVFSMIAINQDGGHHPKVVSSLLRNGFVEATEEIVGFPPVAVKRYFVPIPVHIRWCEWCSEHCAGEEE